MTEAEIRAHLAEQFKDLTPGQRTSAIEAFIVHESRTTPAGFKKCWEYAGDTAALLIEARLNHVRAAHPEFFKAPPSVMTLLTLAEQEHTAQMGSPMLPTKRTDTFRRLEKLDADGRIAELGDRKAPPVAHPAPVSGNVPASGEDMDAELRRRGLDPATMLAGDKLRWYRKFDTRHKEAAAVMTGSSDDPSLSPAQRMTLFRKEQAAHTVQKQSARDPRTGLSQDRNRA